MDSIRFESMSLSMFLLLVLVVGLIVFILLIEPRLSKKKIKNNNEHGSSKFADMKEIKDNFNKEDLNDINKAGFPVWYEKENSKFKNVYYDTKSPHYILIGSTGSGKSVTVSIPMCIQFATAKEKHSVVITDPKAELFKTTGKIFENNGYFSLFFYCALHTWGQINQDLFYIGANYSKIYIYRFIIIFV